MYQYNLNLNFNIFLKLNKIQMYNYETEDIGIKNFCSFGEQNEMYYIKNMRNNYLLVLKVRRMMLQFFLRSIILNRKLTINHTYFFKRKREWMKNLQFTIKDK